jgi:hypothetical protein
MKSRVETDSYGRKKVYDACLEPCAIEKGMRFIGDQLSITSKMGRYDLMT